MTNTMKYKGYVACIEFDAAVKPVSCVVRLPAPSNGVRSVTPEQPDDIEWVPA
jgi:hypothetical protein